MATTLTIYDLGVCFTWQGIRAHQFHDESLADLFMERVEGRWCKVPSEDTHHRPIWKVTNDVGCFVQSFRSQKLKPNAKEPH